MIRRSLGTAVLLLGAFGPLPAQAPPVLQAVRDLTVDGKNARLDNDSRIKVSANGTIAIAQVQGTQVILVDRDMRRIQILGTPGDKPGAINNVQWFGWIGDSLWVADLKVHRITLFAPDRSVARTMSIPLSVEGPPGTKVTDHSRMAPIVEAISPTGSLLIREFFLGIPNSGAGGFLLRTSGAGQYQGNMGAVGPDDGYCMTTRADLPLTSVRMYCAVPAAAVAPSGRFKARVRWPPMGGDSSHFSVTNVGERGDTVYTRTIPFTPLPVSSTDLDSAMVKRMAHMLGGPVADSATVKRIDQNLRATSGTVQPPVTTLLAGNDGTVWLELPSHESGRHWLELDPTGKSVGTVTIPVNVKLLQAEHGTVWGRETLEDGSISIVRYHVGPALRP